MSPVFIESIVEDDSLSDMLLLKSITIEKGVKGAECCQVSTTRSTDFRSRSQQVMGPRGR